MPPATTTSCGRPESSFCQFLALGNIHRPEPIHLLDLVDQRSFLARRRDIPDKSLRIRLGQAQHKVVGNGGKQRRVEVSCFLGRQHERDAVLPARLRHCRDQFQPGRPVGLIEDQGMCDPLLNASAEHVLVETVEHERGECPLQGVVLGRVDANDGGPVVRPETLARLSEVEESVVLELGQTRQRRTQSTVRLRLGAQNLDETTAAGMSPTARRSLAPTGRVGPRVKRGAASWTPLR